MRGAPGAAQPPSTALCSRALPGVLAIPDLTACLRNVPLTAAALGESKGSSQLLQSRVPVANTTTQALPRHPRGLWAAWCCHAPCPGEGDCSGLQEGGSRRKQDIAACSQSHSFLEERDFAGNPGQRCLKDVFFLAFFNILYPHQTFLQIGSVNTFSSHFQHLFLNPTMSRKLYAQVIG